MLCCRATQRTEFEPLNAMADSIEGYSVERLEAFRQRLGGGTSARPGVRSGNFLYIALRSLRDLEREVIDFAAVHGWHGLTPTVQPDQMLGLEVNHYAAELARTALWIGYIPVAPRQRLPVHAAAGPDTAGHHTADGRHTRPHRPAASGRRGVASGRVHRRQPTVLGRQVAAHRTERRIRGRAVQAV